MATYIHKNTQMNTGNNIILALVCLWQCGNKVDVLTIFHPSISFTHFSFLGHRELVSIAVTALKVTYALDRSQVHHMGHIETTIYTLTHTEEPFGITSSVRVITRAECMGRTCKLHQQAPRLGSNPFTFSLRSGSSNN